jgi:hypothetical protein
MIGADIDSLIMVSGEENLYSLLSFRESRIDRRKRTLDEMEENLREKKPRDQQKLPNFILRKKINLRINNHQNHSKKLILVYTF